MKFDLAIRSVRLASKMLKIPMPQVYVSEEQFFVNKEYTALFIRDQYEIVFNKDWVNRVDGIEVIITAFHETRHAYQKYCINTRTRENIKTIEQWEKEEKNYIAPSGKNTPIDDILYLKQDSEIDAIAFAAHKVKKLFNVHVFIPDIIKEIVFRRIEEIRLK